MNAIQAPGEPTRGTCPRILLLRPRLIGDVVFTTPIVRALRRRFPCAHLAYLVEPAAAPILEGNPHLNRLIVVPSATGVTRLRLDAVTGLQLRRERYDIAIDLHGGPRSAWLTWMSGAPTRIGYTIRGRSWMYTHAVARPADDAPRHSVVNQWDLLTPLDIAAPDPARDAVEMPADAAVEARVRARLEQAGVTRNHALVVLHVSASNPFRRWPEAAFSRLIDLLARRDPARRFVLTAGPSDVAAAGRVAAGARDLLGPLAGGVVDIGDFDLGELRALAALAAVYIGGDSGPAHVAATTPTPIVQLLGPTLPERSHPWRDPRWFAEMVDAGPLPCRPCRQRTCAPGDFRCLTAITPEQVALAAERAFAEGLPERAPLRAEELHA